MEEKKRLEDLFDTYYDRVYAFLYTRLSNVSQAEDLASQTFLKIAEKIGTYKPEKGALSTWIFTIALNEMRSYFRSVNGKENINLDDIAELKDEADIESRYDEYESKQTVLSLLKCLDERQRSIVGLKYYGGLSNREIGGILGISETNVGTILGRTIQKLKDMLKKCDESPDFAYKVQEEKR